MCTRSALGEKLEGTPRDDSHSDFFHSWAASSISGEPTGSAGLLSVEMPVLLSQLRSVSRERSSSLFPVVILPFVRMCVRERHRETDTEVCVERSEDNLRWPSGPTHFLFYGSLTSLEFTKSSRLASPQATGSAQLFLPSAGLQVHTAVLLALISLCPGCQMQVFVPTWEILYNRGTVSLQVTFGEEGRGDSVMSVKSQGQSSGRSVLGLGTLSYPASSQAA